MLYIFSLLCFGNTNFSLGATFYGLHAKLSYIRLFRKNNIKIKILKTPQVNHESQEVIIGEFPAYRTHQSNFDIKWKKVFDSVTTADVNAYDKFGEETLEELFQLTHSMEHRKPGGYQFSNENSKSFLLLDEELKKNIQKAVNTFDKANPGKIKGGDIYLQEVDGKEELVIFHNNGRNIKTLIGDESVFEGDLIKIVIGNRMKFTPSGRLDLFKIARSVNSLNLSLDYLVRAGIVSERAGGKPIELLVVGTQGITEEEIRKRVDQIIDSEEYSRQVGAALPNERHFALMGGVGLSAGYHRHTENFIFNLRTGVDHIWGKFKQTGPQSIDTENVPRLGWGLTVGTGLDYKFTEKSTIGIEGGVRLSEFKIPQQVDPKTTKSSWFMAPYAQIVCGFYPTPDYSVSVFTGYFFPRTFTVKTEGTKITEGTQCKVDGIFGGLRFARYF